MISLLSLDIEKCLNKTEAEYRKLEPGSYLYNMVLSYNYERKFSQEFIELVYVTLSAWNMNSRGAKLSDYESFKNSILANKTEFDKLKNKGIKDLDDSHFNVLQYLFSTLKLVQSKAPLVTFSKLMHFFLPNTVAPIDRKYTLYFYNKSTNIPKSVVEQFNLYKAIHTDYRNFAQNVDLSKYVKSSGWNRTEPKVIDNIIIGFQKLHMSKH